MRRIKNAKIRFLSLVPRGANRMPVIYKSDDAIDFDTIIKASDDFNDSGELTCVVYAPEVRDSQGDIASAAVIKEMAHDYLRSGRGIDIKHDEKTLNKDDAFVAESFIIQKGDPRFVDFKDYDGNAVDVTGGWAAVLKINDPALRKSYREGKWNGVSMGGSGTLAVEKDDQPGLLSQVIGALADRLGLSKATPVTKEDDMKPEEVTTLVQKELKPVADMLSKIAEKVGITKDGKETAKKDEPAPAPVFKGEATAINLKKHSIAVRRHAITSTLDYSDTEAVEKATKDLAALDTELAALTKEEGKGGKKDGKVNKEGLNDEQKDAITKLEEEKAALEAKIAKINKGSNVKKADDDAEDDDDTEVDGSDRFTKEQVSDYEAGVKLAKRAQKALVGSGKAD